MALKRCFIKTLLALIAVCAFIACTNSSDDTGGGNTEGGNTPSVPQVREYTVRFTAGEGGTITAKAGGQNIESGSKVKKDTLVTFTAVQEEGKAVKEWSITGGSFAQGSGTPGSDTAKVNAAADINVHVSFKDATPGKHVVNFSVDGNVEDGSIEAKLSDESVIRSGNEVPDGSTVIFTAVPDTANGRKVKEWKITGGSFKSDPGTGNSAQVQVITDINVHVSFKDATPGKHVVNFSVDGNVEDGSIEAKLSDESVIQSGNEVPDGSIVTFTALPDTANGRKVKEWKITGGSFISDPGTENSAQVQVITDINVHVSFKDATPGKHVVNFSVDGNVEDGSIEAKLSDESVIQSGNEVPDGSIVIFTAVPDTANGRKVKEWKITGGSFISDPGTENSAQVQVTAPISVTLSFEKKSYTVSFGVQGGHGTLSAKKEDNSPFTSGSKASHGDVITFTAGPHEGYITEGWTGAEADAQDTKTARVTVTSDLEVNVTFKPIPPNTASYKIEHYKEALDGQYTATPAETDDKTGIVGTAAVVELKSYEGFEKDRQEPENAIISAGAVIKVYYKRKTVRLTFHLAGGNIEGVPDDAVREGKYGTTLETPVPVKEGCTLSGWDPAPPPVFPSSPAEYTAQWQALPSITVRITVKGDERVDEASSGFVDITDPKTWGKIKAQIEAKLTLKAEWQGGDYGAYAWKLGSENGEALTDGHTVSEDTTVYAVTNYTKFRMNGTVLLGYAGTKPRGRIIIPDGVTEIGDNAFRDCRGFRGSLDLSACTKLTKIEREAFQGCSGFTGELKLPANITEIGYSAFSGCKGFTGSLDLSACTQLTKIEVGAFSSCSGFTGELKLPVNITEIGVHAFSGGGFTGSLDLSACTKLTKIEQSAFYKCSGFTGALKLPANITEIGLCAFDGCKGFTGSLDLSTCTKLTKIEWDAFNGCSGFTGELKLPVNITEIDLCAFDGCTGFTGSLDLSACTKLTKIGQSAFSGCSGFTGELKLPVNITEIGLCAFDGCKGFTGSLDLSACTKLTKIEWGAFSGCSGFTGELKLPVNITEIGDFAFKGCTGFTGSLDLSACTKLTKIGQSAFSGCSGFTGELKLPVNITEIGESAFSGCTKAEIKLPQSITKIGSKAFGNDSGSFCKKVKVPSGAEYDRIKTLVTQSSYPENRIERY